MILRLLAHLLAVAVAFAVASWLVPGFDVEGGVLALLWLALLFGLVDTLIGPLLRLVSLPLTAMTLGLFTLVVNGVLIAIVAGLSDHLQVGRFGWTIVAALLITVVSGLLGYTIDRPLARRAGAR
jgi:putative membrane protein